MNVIAIIERGSDNTYDVRMSDDRLNFMLLGQGDTVALAIKDFLVSGEEMKELYEEEGKEYPELECTYKYDLSSFLEYYSNKLGYASLERITGVNQRQLNQYVQGYRNPSAKTTQKIENGLKAFANEISQVQFV